MAKKKFEVKSWFNRGIKSDSATELLEKFIQPFAKKLEGVKSMDEVLNLFFNCLTRDLFFVRIEENCRLPGQYYIAGSRVIDGTGPKWCVAGTVLIVRVDETLDYVDVERVIDNEEHTFRLTIPEWKWLQTKVKILA